MSAPSVSPRQIRENAKASINLPTTSSISRVVCNSGAPLEAVTRRDMEGRFGEDFSAVRLHTGAEAARSAADINARAYTVGNHIVFGEHGSPSDRRLLAHELAHVTQQSESPLAREMVLRQLENYPAGGCATCQPAANAGSMAHPVVQSMFPARDVLPEEPIYPGDDNGRLDLVRIDRKTKPWVVEIGEIKPDNDQGRKDGKRDLEWYERELSRSLRPPDWFVSRFSDAAPTTTAQFIDYPGSTCTIQTLSVRGPKIGGTPGLYLYSCSPPGRRAGARNPPCCNQRRDRSGDGDRPPVIIGDRLEQGGRETKGKTDEPGKGKGNGDSRQRDRSRRSPGRSPDISPSLLTALTIIAGILSLLPWGRIGAAIGAALGTLLRALGLSLGIGLGTAAAEGKASSDEAGGGEATRRVPGKTVTVPGETVTVPGETVMVPGTDVRRPSGEKRRPQTTQGGKGGGSVGTAGTKMLKFTVIEGMRVDAVKKGATYWVMTNRKQLMVLQAVDVTTTPGSATATFVSVSEMDVSSPVPRTLPAGNGYWVTHPARATADPAPLLGNVLPRASPDDPSVKILQELLGNK